MTAPSRPAALRAGAAGLYALEATAGLIIAHATWLTRDDFTCFIAHGTETAAIDWEAAVLPWKQAVSQAQEGNAERSAWQPASPAKPPSPSAMPSPASTTATSD